MKNLKHKTKTVFLVSILTLFMGLSPAIAKEPNEFGTMTPSEAKQEKSFPVTEKFMIAMGGVGISIIIIYLSLLGYKKLQAAKTTAYAKEDYTDDLNSPKNMTEAVNIFLSKSK